MTTEAIGRLRLACGAACALTVWFFGMAAAALVVEPQSVIVFAPQRDAIAIAASADGLILTSGRRFVVARAQGRHFVQRLYRNGAWLVWPSMPRGCLSVAP